MNIPKEGPMSRVQNNPLYTPLTSELALFEHTLWEKKLFSVWKNPLSTIITSKVYLCEHTPTFHTSHNVKGTISQ